MDEFVIITKKNNNFGAENNDKLNINMDNENPINNENLENDEVNTNDDNENPINNVNLKYDKVNANNDNVNIINNENLDNDEVNVSEDNKNPIEENNESPQNCYVDGFNHNAFDVRVWDGLDSKMKELLVIKGVVRETNINYPKDRFGRHFSCEHYVREIMPQLNQKDYQRTKAYLLRIHRSKAMDEEVRESYGRLESHLFHEGIFVTPSFIEVNNMLPTFQAVGLESLPTLDEPICPIFIVEFYHILEVKRDEEERPYIELKLGQFTFDKSTHYTSSSSLNESPTPSHVAPLPKLRFVIPLKLKPQELPSLTSSQNDPYVSTMDNWPPGPSKPFPPPRVTQPPLGFPHLPLGFEPLPSTQSLLVNINNNTLHIHNNASPLESIYHPPPNLGNQDFPNPLNIMDFVHPNDMPHLHNIFCQCCSTTRHEIQMLRNRVNYMFSYI
nr:zinc finger MYM-type protein 1-like [Tanacetum cinerariifolium]